MINGYDIAWGAILGLGAPFWLVQPRARRKVLRALSERMGRGVPRAGTAPAVMIHAVSLGEINATRALVRMLAEARPDLYFVVSTTTDTGFARGRELYGAEPRVTLIRYPLDFTGAVARVLDNLRPALVVLMELEVWPNFLRQCERRDIPVLLINGRLTESSYRNYRLGGPLVARMFRRRTGDTLHGYLTAVRVARAREHILHGHKIEAVMLLVGYRSKKNFYRQFRAATGVTPGAYRDAHGWTQDA